MDAWIGAALRYIPEWIGYQLDHVGQPGCVVAVAHRGEVVLERAFGVADLATGEALTPRHRFRVASHSKSFTAAGIMRLREAGQLGLDDAVGRHVPDLAPVVARVTLAELLSHSAGLSRDGPDADQFFDRRPYLSEAELRADLALPQPLQPGETFKYSNHGFALLGLVVAAVTGEPYAQWIKREVIERAGLAETEPDITSQPQPLYARGHSMRQPLGRRLVIPGDNPGHAITAAGGFVSTAADLARYFWQLAPDADTSWLSAASRRQMTRRHWRDRDSAIERYYGLGIIAGPPGPWTWWGHSGGWQGTLSRTVVLPGRGLSLSVLTNAIDGPAHLIVDGIIHCLKTFEDRGAPGGGVADWTGRWWTMWGAVDLVAMGEEVLVAAPAQALPFIDAGVLRVTGVDTGAVQAAQAFGDLAEPVTRMRDAAGRWRELRIGGKRLVDAAALTAELSARYGRPAGPSG